MPRSTRENKVSLYFSKERILILGECQKKTFSQRYTEEENKRIIIEYKFRLQMELNKTTEKIIGCAIEVHKYLGPGLLESAYEECLAHELISAGFKISRQHPVPIVYKDIKLECGYRIDILVENTIILELKSVDVINPVHEAQILTYMKFAQKEIGLLMNFNVTLLRNGLKRYRM
jgi:GxxExxY protein